MKNNPVKRAVYYGMILVCLVAAVVTLFMPALTKDGSDWSPFTGLSLLARNMDGSHYDYSSVEVIMLLFTLVAAIVAGTLLYSAKLLLRSLDREGRGPQKPRLGAGPILGVCFPFFVYAAALYFRSEDLRYYPLRDGSLTVWPFVTFALSWCALSLCASLCDRPEEQPTPAPASAPEGPDPPARL